MSIQKLVRIGILCLLVCVFQRGLAQDSAKLNQLISVPDQLFTSLDSKTKSIETKLDRQTVKYLSKFQKQESKLKKKLWKQDSLLAKKLFAGVDSNYQKLKNAGAKINKYTSLYSGHLDSLATTLSFLKGSSLSANPALEKTLDRYKSLQEKLDASEKIKAYITSRQKLLKEQFENLGMLKDLKQFRKDCYYYTAQVKAYQDLFEDPDKMEAKVMELAMQLPQFKEFFAKNSMLGSLFALPGSASSPAATLVGLQSRALVNQTLVERFGSSSAVTQMLQQNVQSAQGELSQLQNKVSGLSKGSYANGSDKELPSFKPNTQKTKSFLQRLEYGADIQTQKSRTFFPVTSDLGLSLGYKLNDNSVIGIGASYKMGWGSGFNHIRITHQGAGVRSYIDWKIKGSFFVSGGYEMNYKSEINSVVILNNYSAWQKSGLIGINKKYSVSKKLKGDMKLLWDFLSYQQVPKSQPIVFRIGYSFK